MDREKLIVGYDLCSDYSQISYYNIKKQEPDSISLNGQVRIPTALCRIFEDGTWVIGQDALKAAADGRGALVRGFAENMANDPLIDVASERIEKTELLYQFMLGTMSALKELGSDTEIGYMTITTEQIDLATADVLKMVGQRLGIADDALSVQSHRLSYEYYALSQRRELWIHDVGMFEYDTKGLRYHHLSISWKHHPAAAIVEDIDLSHYMNGQELENPVAPELDRQFLAAIKEVSAKRAISTYYLVGDGFEGVGEGSGWLNLSLKQLCSMKRHVFVGQNLYARGACYNSYFQGYLGKPPGFLGINADLMMKDIYIRSIHRNVPGKLVLASAGIPWYSVDAEKMIIPTDSDQLVFHIRDIMTNYEQIAVMHLDGMEERQDKTCKLAVQISFRSETECHIRVTDMGFGEIFASSGRVWEKDFDINTVSETAEHSNRESVIEATQPKEVLALDMKVSGMRIFSLEELCWYMARNVYVITEDIFDEKMFYWMDKITGEHSLASALSNYKETGKSLKELVRMLLSSIDYLNSTEIAYVYNKLAEIEHQNPIEQARMAADNYIRYGYYITALKSYHHVIWQMEYGDAMDVTRQFKSEVWHNMGLAFLHLHDLDRAVECMEKAFMCVKDEENLRSYVYALAMVDDQKRILTLSQEEELPKQMTDRMLEVYRGCESAYVTSDRYTELKNHMDEDRNFTKSFLQNEKKKYDLM